MNTRHPIHTRRSTLSRRLLPAPRSNSWQALCMLAAASLTGAVIHAQPSTAEDHFGEGIWKAVVPPVSMKGEFDNFDPLGVAAGARIKADCSLNWVDPDDGKLYCFSSGTSLVYFLDRPHANIERARRRWTTLSVR